MVTVPVNLAVQAYKLVLQGGAITIKIYDEGKVLFIETVIISLLGAKDTISAIIMNYVR